MATRLTHPTQASFLTFMRMSEVRIFVFVEGRLDRYFYSRICDSVLTRTGVRYTLMAADELPGGQGGKNGVLEFYHFLRTNTALIGEFQGKTTASIFYLDKDVDDFLGKIEVSGHVCYSKYYTVENYLFIWGDLVHALAVAAALDTVSVREGLVGSNQEWRYRAGSNWKEWVKCCLFTRIHCLNSECNYSVPSRINTDSSNAYSPLDEISYARCQDELRNRAGMTETQFQRAFSRISHTVERIFAGGKHDVIFNGKWYTHFLTADAKRIGGNRRLDMNRLDSGIKISLQARINYGAPWARHLRQPVQNMVRLLNEAP